MGQGKQVITKNGRTYALVIRRTQRPSGVNFITPHAYSLQLGLIKHPVGHVVSDHIHNPAPKYEVDTTQEFLYLESGKVEATIYDESWKVIKKIILNPGDMILQVAGGHGFKVLEEASLIEVKQGPYPGDQLNKFTREPEQ